jgi:F-type H+-transporting ATPase subunit delta
MPVLFRIRRQFDVLYDRAHKRLPVEVTSAVELDSGVVQELERRIEEQTGQNVTLESRVDPSIVGGIVLRVGNSILDASIRHRLDQLRREVAKAA